MLQAPERQPRRRRSRCRLRTEPATPRARHWARSDAAGILSLIAEPGPRDGPKNRYDAYAGPNRAARGLKVDRRLRPRSELGDSSSRTFGRAVDDRRGVGSEIASCADYSPPEARRHCPQVLQNASLKSGFAARGIELLQWVRTVAAATTPHAAIARCQLRADAWPPRPRAAQPNLNRSDTTPIPTEYKGPRDRVRVRSECVGVEPCVRFRRTSSNGGELAPVSSTDSRIRRGRR